MDWWAVAAGRPVHARTPIASVGAATAASSWWSRIPLAQRLRIGLGVAGVLLIGVYAMVDGAIDASGREASQQPASTTVVRSEELAGGAGGTPPTAGVVSTTRPNSSTAPATPASGGMTSASPAPQLGAAPTIALATAAPPAATATSLPTPTPVSLPTTVVLEASGSTVTESFAYPGGSVRVRSLASTGSGTGCFYIGTFRSTDPALLTVDPSFLTAVIFLETAGSGEGWVDLILAPGSYFMEIESDCNWVVTIAPA